MKEIKDLVFLIEALDKCRLGKVEDPDRLEKIVHKYRLSSTIKWKNIRKAIYDIARLPRRDPSFKKLRYIVKISEILLLISIIIPLSLYLTWILGYGVFLSYYIFFSALVIINLSYILRWYSLTKVAEIYRKNIDKLASKGEAIREGINKLIYILRKRLEKHKVDPDKVKIKLYNIDYDNIKVLKEPGKMSSKYTVYLI